MGNEKVVGIRISTDEFKRIEALAKADDRKVATYLKRVLLRQLPILEAEGATLNEPPVKYTVKCRAKKAHKK